MQMEQIQGCASSKQSLLSTICSALNPGGGRRRIVYSSSTQWLWICKRSRDTFSLRWRRSRGLCRPKPSNFSLPDSLPGTHRSTEVNPAPRRPSRTKAISIFERQRASCRRRRTRILWYLRQICRDEIFSNLDPRLGATAGWSLLRERRADFRS